MKANNKMQTPYSLVWF